jgi:uncharacterized membrane protein HdeD (DUF308 family)
MLTFVGVAGNSQPSSGLSIVFRVKSAQGAAYWEEAMTAADVGLDDSQRSFRQAIREHWGLFLIQGLVMVILGLLAVAAPVIATLAVEIYAGWLFLISGIVGLVTLLKTRNIPAFWWTLIAAALAILVGVLLIFKPAAGILTLTLVLTAFFIAEGMTQIVAAFMYRKVLANSWAWALFSGIVDLILAAIIIMGWPGTAAWALGLLVGINLFMSGLALVMLAIGSRSLPDVSESPKPAV